MILSVTSAPATEPVTTAEAKAHLRIATDFTDDDTKIDAFIAAARAYVETFTGRSLVTRTYALRARDFCELEGSDGVIRLPRPPLASVSSVAYVDTNDASQTISSANYHVLAGTDGGTLEPILTYAWPQTRGLAGDVTITYIAGYGAASSVPDDFKAAILLLVGELYENREDAIVGAIVTTAPLAADRLLAPYRTPNVLVAA